jgi:hypothetical protein
MLTRIGICRLLHVRLFFGAEGRTKTLGFYPRFVGVSMRKTLSLALDPFRLV